MARRTWRLPGYRVEALIGAGASGEVWRASVASTGVPVALKRIWLSERAERDAAIGEAAMLSTLDHPHLMKLHEVRTADDAVVLVLDLAAAGPLSTLLARRGRLTPGETVTALAPIGSALAYAHNRGVTHGDVSAANILFTDIGLPLLADLGVARLFGESAPVRTTPSYADPVVAAGGVPRPESDVFMLAAVTLHALTGSVPWPGTDAVEVLETAAATGRQPDFADRMLGAGVPAEMSTGGRAGPGSRPGPARHRGRVRPRPAAEHRTGRGGAHGGALAPRTGHHAVVAARAPGAARVPEPRESRSRASRGQCRNRRRDRRRDRRRCRRSPGRR